MAGTFSEESAAHRHQLCKRATARLHANRSDLRASVGHSLSKAGALSPPCSIPRSVKRQYRTKRISIQAPCTRIFPVLRGWGCRVRGNSTAILPSSTGRGGLRRTDPGIGQAAFFRAAGVTESGLCRAAAVGLRTPDLPGAFASLPAVPPPAVGRAARPARPASTPSPPGRAPLACEPVP